MKNKYLRMFFVSIYVLSLFFSGTVFAKSPLEDLQSQLKINEKEATKLLRAVGVLMRNAQRGISIIANSDYPYNDKIGDNGYINGVIKDNFSSKWSSIYVSSINSSNLIEYYVSDYLKHLANLSGKDGKYNNVKISFNKGMKITNLNHYNDKTEMSVNVFQLFRGCKRTYESVAKCYTDVTKKTFVVKIDHNYGGIGKARIYIDSLGVKDTYTLKEAEGIVDDFTIE